MHDYYVNKIKILNYVVKKSEKEKIELQMIKKVIQLIITVQKNRKIIELSKTNIQDYEYYLKKEGIKYKKGLTSFKSYSKIKAKLTQKLLSLQELEKVYKDKISEINRYVSMSEGEINSIDLFKLKSFYFDDQEKAKKDILKKSPIARIQKGNILLYKMKAKRLKNYFYPSVDFTAKHSITNDSYDNGIESEDKETTLSINMNFSLYNGNKDYNSYQKAICEYKGQAQKDIAKVDELKYELDVDYNSLNLYHLKY